MPGPTVLPEPCTAPGAGWHGGMPRGVTESLSPWSWGQKQRFNSKTGANQKKTSASPPPVISKGRCSAPKRNTQPHPSQTFWAEIGRAVPPSLPRLGAVVTLAEVRADVNLLVAICRPAGAGVAVAEAAGAADGVVGLQVKPARLAPGHREETGVRGTGQAELQGTTAVSLCGTPVTAPCEPSPSGPEECSPASLPPSPRLERDSVRVPMPGHGAYLLHKCPSTLSLQVQCPVLGSQVPTLPAGSQMQGLDGVK